MDRFKAVDAEQFGDVHCAGFGNAAQVVAHQVADHDVFPAFLGVVLQSVGQHVVFFRGASASNGAFDGGGNQLITSALQEQLGGAANHVEFAGFDQGSVRRLGEVVQAHECVPWGFQFLICTPLLAEVHLVDVSAMDVLFDAVGPLQICTLIPSGFERDARPWRQRLSSGITSCLHEL